jgi:nuclear transport factor 2 (NTF2) superfamily protein
VKASLLLKKGKGGTSMTISIRPPFTRETALAKVRAAEDAWNSRDPVRVSLAYSTDSIWRNRDQFLSGRRQIQEFLAGKWQRELDYRLVKALWLVFDSSSPVFDVSPCAMGRVSCRA